MKLETLLSNIFYLLNTIDVVGKVDEIKSMIKHDLDGTDNDDLMGDLENLENLLDDLEVAFNEVENAADELSNNEAMGGYDEEDEEDDEAQK